jgi:serine/threonine protein kinase
MQIGAYRLISRLGSGGMGEVWRAEDTKLLRECAIKILPPNLAGDPEWKERFMREARSIAQVTHPNIATIYNIEQDGDTLFMAMELVEGEPLGTMIGRGPMIPLDAVRVATHVADGLGEAHRKGIVHRDVKPDNIIVSTRYVKVLDFGIAKQLGPAADANLTQNNMVVGTPHYMSPEQAMGRTVDSRTDIFSLGVVLYEMLSGKKPFTGNAVTETLLKIVMHEPVDIAKAAAGITPALADVVRRCMMKQPDQRFPDCDELRTALVKSLKEDPSAARQSRIPTIAVRAPQRPEQRRVEPEPPPRPAVSSHPAPTPPPSPTATPGARPVSVPVSRATAGAHHALVADDDPATRYILCNILQRFQFTYDEADNGADAVKLLKSNKYSLIFVDLLMPRVDGWGVIDYVRSHRGAVMPRVFVVTGVQNQKLSTADQDVVSGLLYKPIDINKVELLVQKSA